MVEEPLGPDHHTDWSSFPYSATNFARQRQRQRRRMVGVGAVATALASMSSSSSIAQHCL